MDIFKVLFCNGITLEQLSNIYGYDEDTIIGMLDDTTTMTIEEKEALEKAVGHKLYT